VNEFYQFTNHLLPIHCKYYVSPEDRLKFVRAAEKH